MIRILSVATLLLFSVTASANEAVIRKALEEGFGGKIESVTKTKYGLWEVYAGGRIWYTDDKASYILGGTLFDAKSGRNLTEERMNKLTAINFKDLPLNMAIKTVRGNGTRVLATFEDPNCGYCKHLAKDIATLNDVTIYTFLYPILSPDSVEKSKSIWCSKDQGKAWSDWMERGVSPTASGTCNNPVDKLVELGGRLGIQGTPTLFFMNGERVPGAIPLAQIEKMLSAPKVN